MKNNIIIRLLAALPLLGCLSACHEPEYISSTADRQGLTSLTAIISEGIYANKELTKLTIDEEMYNSGQFVLEIPYYYPETSTDESVYYMTALRIQAELEPNFKIVPGLGLLDMTESYDFTLECPDGTSRPITISAKRVKPSACQLLSFFIEDYAVSGIIYEEEGRVLVPFLEDLSDVTFTAQVSSHAKISKISGQSYLPGMKYDLGTGATITVLAGNGTTSKTYTIEQGIPELLDFGLNTQSIAPLFNIDPVAMAGLPAYTTLSYVSLAGLGNNVIVCTGSDATPVYLNCFTGAKLGQINTGGATVDVITNDEAGHMLLANYAEGGLTAGEVNIWRTSSVEAAPTLFYSFTNPVDVPIGHRMKVLGNIDADAVICFTAEGIDGVTTTAKAVYLLVKGGSVQDVYVKDFVSLVGGWGSAPINFATVVPAGLDPVSDGWFLDYYEENCDADGNYLLHYIDGSMNDNIVSRIGDWGNNPNCLDIKEFNGARYMSLFVVSHFPCWGRPPQLYLFDASSPSSTSLVVSNTSLSFFQDGDYSGDTGASGDVVICPTTDGYRIYIYYYDHHAHSIGAYVADCFKN